MTESDLTYIQQLLNDKVITGPVLELGTSYGGMTCRDIIVKEGLDYFTSDIAASPYIDFVADFERIEFLSVFSGQKFNCILVLNVLEHTFYPICVLDNVRTLLDNQGKIVVIAPTVWTLHNYPIDCYRIMPQWYEKYADKSGLKINYDYFEYLGYGKVKDYTDLKGNYIFPPPTRSRLQYWRSRLTHYVFNTFGRSISFQNHLAIGVVYEA